MHTSPTESVTDAQLGGRGSSTRAQGDQAYSARRGRMGSTGVSKTPACPRRASRTSRTGRLACPCQTTHRRLGSLPLVAQAPRASAVSRCCTPPRTRPRCGCRCAWRHVRGLGTVLQAVSEPTMSGIMSSAQPGGSGTPRLSQRISLHALGTSRRARGAAGPRRRRNSRPYYGARPAPSTGYVIHPVARVGVVDERRGSSCPSAGEGARELAGAEPRSAGPG